MDRALAWGMLISVVLLTTVALAAVACAPMDGGRIELSSTEHDFGQVASTETISHTLQVRNAGTAPLSITGVSTSCGCTTAEISAQALAPGEAADLLVTFDPQAHGGAAGDYMRQVYVRSSDPGTPEAVVTFRVTVVESKAP